MGRSATRARILLFGAGAVGVVLVTMLMVALTRAARTAAAEPAGLSNRTMFDAQAGDFTTAVVVTLVAAAAFAVGGIAWVVVAGRGGLWPCYLLAGIALTALANVAPLTAAVARGR